MKTHKKLILSITAIFIWGCGEKDPSDISDPNRNGGNPSDGDIELSLSTDYLAVVDAKNQQIISLTANTNWSISGQYDWCVFSATNGTKGSHQITIDIAATPLPDARRAEFKVTAGTETVGLTITQRGQSYILVVMNDQTIKSEGEEIETFVLSNIEFDVIIPNEHKSWLAITSPYDPNTYGIKVSVAGYDGTEDRYGQIVFKDRVSSYADTLRIRQLLLDRSSIEIPDPHFRNFCLANFDTNFDGILSHREAQSVKTMKLPFYNNNIVSLQGIEFFTGLIDLSCTNSKLASLDLSNNPALVYLTLTNTELTALDLSKNSEIMFLDCSNNKITSLMLNNHPKLFSLDCQDNQLETLIIGDNNIFSVECYNNKLTALDVSRCAKLQYLDCYDNQISGLDMSPCISLKSLDCRNNKLSYLNPGPSRLLTSLYCENNLLTALDVSRNILLGYLDCDINPLTSLNLTGLLDLSTLCCRTTNLIQLDISTNTSLKYLYANPNTSLQKIWVWPGFVPPTGMVGFSKPDAAAYHEK